MYDPSWRVTALYNRDFLSLRYLMPVFALLVILFATLPLVAQVDVLTHRYDGSRAGVNNSESTLTPANVKSATFGKLFSLPVDGQEYAQPLYKSNVLISGQGIHNVLYVATEHDTLYAYDADGQSAQPLWQKSFIDPTNGITPVPSGDYAGTDLVPEVGI